VNPQDITRFRRALEKAAVVFKETLTDTLVEEYFSSLRDFTTAQVEDAITAHIKRGRYFPRPAELRKRCGDEGDVDKPKTATRCCAPNCPNPVAWIGEEGSVCRWHSHAPKSEWPEVTAGILAGDVRYEYPPVYQDRCRLRWLVETGQFEAMPAVCGERGMRWAREEVRAGRMKPRSWNPSPESLAETRRWLNALVASGAYFPTDNRSPHDETRNDA
jgi:hypothetical protein